MEIYQTCTYNENNLRLRMGILESGSSNSIPTRFLSSSFNSPPTARTFDNWIVTRNTSIVGYYSTLYFK